MGRVIRDPEHLAAICGHFGLDAADVVEVELLFEDGAPPDGDMRKMIRVRVRGRSGAAALAERPLEMGTGAPLELGGHQHRATTLRLVAIGERMRARQRLPQGLTMGVEYDGATRFTEPG